MHLCFLLIETEHSIVINSCAEEGFPYISHSKFMKKTLHLRHNQSVIC